MDLLKYLEPMKNLPERFSNLAFWRGVRKLRDEVVNAFEYVDSWGKSIESSIDSQKPPFYYNDLTKLVSVNITDTFWTKVDLIAVDTKTLIVFKDYLQYDLDVKPNSIPFIEISTLPQFSCGVGFCFSTQAGSPGKTNIVIYGIPTLANFDVDTLKEAKVHLNYF